MQRSWGRSEAVLLLCSRKSTEIPVAERSKPLRVLEEAMDGRLGQTVKNLQATVKTSSWSNQNGRIRT